MDVLWRWDPWVKAWSFSSCRIVCGLNKDNERYISVQNSVSIDVAAATRCMFCMLLSDYICQSGSVYLCLLIFCVSVCLCLSLSVCLYVCLSVCLSVCLTVCLSVCLSDSLSDSLSLSLSLSLNTSLVFVAWCCVWFYGVSAILLIISHHHWS